MDILSLGHLLDPEIGDKIKACIVFLTPDFYHKVRWHILILQVMRCGHLKSNADAMIPRSPC